MNCPECGQLAECDLVDNGIGMQQCGPYGCEPCGWVQESPDDADLWDTGSQETPCPHICANVGPRARRVYGSAPTEVCVTCGAWRMIKDDGSPLGIGEWKTDVTIEEWNSEEYDPA